MPHSNCGPETLACGAFEQNCSNGFIVQPLSDTGQVGFVDTYTSSPLLIRFHDTHYENMPIQIYRKFHPQKLKIFR